MAASPGVPNAVAAKLATAAAKDPAVQQAVQQAAITAAADPAMQQAVQQAARDHAQAASKAAATTFVGSFTVYAHRLLVVPQLRPFKEFFKLSVEDTADWFPFFGKWNLLWVQVNVLAFVVNIAFLLLVLVFSLFTALVSVMFSLLGGTIRLAIIFLAAHSGYYFIAEKGGCCGSCGVVTFFFTYVFLSIATLAGLVRTDDDGWWVNFFYFIVLVPAFYMCLALWKVGAGVATRSGVKRAWAAGQAAMKDPNKPQTDAEAARAPGKPDAGAVEVAGAPGKRDAGAAGAPRK